MGMLKTRIAYALLLSIAMLGILTIEDVLTKMKQSEENGKGSKRRQNIAQFRSIIL